MAFNISEHAEKIFFHSPSNSFLWLKGRVPDDVPGVPGMKNEIYVCPFRSDDFAFRRDHGRYLQFGLNEECESEIKKIIERVKQFTWEEDLHLIPGRHIDLYLSDIPIDNSESQGFVTIPSNRISQVFPRYGQIL